MKINEIKSDKFENMIYQIQKYGGCPISATLKVIGGKWKPLILYFISVDINRFGLLLQMINGCSKKMLTSQLRELEYDGLINRKVFPQVPPKVIYSLTEKGESLRPIFHELSKWGIENVLEKKS